MKVIDYSGIENFIQKYYHDYHWSYKYIDKLTESHWLCIPVEPSSILSTEICSFLEECIKSFNNVEDAKVCPNPITLGTYEFYVQYRNRKIQWETYKFNIASFSKSYVCFNIFDEFFDRSFKFLPMMTTTSLLKNNNIKYTADFDWESGSDSIQMYKKMLII